MTTYTRITRAEQLLNNLVARGTLSEAGKDWLVVALDPMHDKQVEHLAGWPDFETQCSVVRQVKKSFTIASNQGAGLNWDAHIIGWPFLNSYRMSNISRGSNYAQTNFLKSGTSNPFMGGVAIYGTAAGSPIDWASASSQHIHSISLDAKYENGASRIIGMGIEVTNTTAPLYKQGLCTVYRTPQARSIQTVTVNGLTGLTTTANMTAHLIKSPPFSTEDAMLIPGSRQWKAEEGCYLVSTFVGQDNPPTLVGYQQPFVPLSDAVEESILQPYTAGENIDTYYMPTIKEIVTDAPKLVSTKIYPLHTNGTIFSGLSAESTLTVTVNFYVESFPSVAQSDILVLATPSAEYDPVALELFSRAMSVMPVGVRAAENGLGDWFAGVIKAVTNFTTPALTALGMPAAAVASGLANTAARSYLTAATPMTPKNSFERERKKKKKQNRKQMLSSNVKNMRAP